MVDKSKRGQVTLFIALGIMLLFSVVTLYVFKGVGPSYGNFKPYVEEVPTELQPLKSFVEQCIVSTAKEGLIIIGSQGGYINPEDEGILILNQNPTMSEGVEFLPGINVPYWYHMSSSDNCVGACNFDQSLTPSNQDIQLRLAKYINENLQFCTRQFEQFPKFTITDSDPEAEANIGYNDIQINVLYPLNIEGESRESEVSKFYATVDLNLRKMLDTARRIASVELEYKFFEHNDLELISIYSGTDSDLLPPISATETEMKNTFWSTFDVKEKLEMLLEQKYMMLQGEFAENTVVPEVSDGDYVDTTNAIYNSMVIPFDGLNGLTVRFSYFSDWPIFLSLNTNSGVVLPEVIMPTLIPGINLAIERYKTIYDLSHPVVIELEDSEAFNGEGYLFRYAVEANIRGNEPLEYENNPLYGAEVEASMFCDYNKRNSGEVHLQVIDANTREPIEGVNVFFNSVESCTIGQTDENGELTTLYPVGIGTISLMKGGYLRFAEADFVTELDTDKEAGIYRMKPLVNKKVEGYIYQLNKMGNTHTISDWIREPSARPIGKNMSVMVVLERIPDSLGETEFIRAIFFEEETASQEVELVEGEYSVKVVTIYDGTITIPHDRRHVSYRCGLRRCTRSYWFPGPEDMILDMPAVVYDTNLRIYKQDLLRDSPIKFYGVYLDMPNTDNLKVEDISVFENAGDRYVEPRK